MSATSPEAPLVVKAAVAAAAFLALAGLLNYFRFETSYQDQNHDPYRVAAQMGRFSDVRKKIPPNGKLGFLSDKEVGTLAGDTLFGTAQYALAPRLLLKTTDSDWVLGDYAQPTDYDAAGAIYGLKVVERFGNGVVLFRKEAK